MPESVFAYRLLFLMLFMASSMTWFFLWLVDYSRQRSTRIHFGKRRLVAPAGLTLILACAVMEFFRLAERNILLVALIFVGLVIPWGLILIIKYSVVSPGRKTRTNN
ncbi:MULTISPECIES: hypothetical protein [Pseudomonas]|uniref:Uncharacterized protein n=1 Tax=Pseudomonas putida TaxID=303 RepID=A0A1B2FEZ8_PSEPU|nr:MULTISPECIES: hypothetical protein [Pseudomonas]ANY90762.1 hypothetical protein IEC33019_5282 [Pseudomonas putida]MCL8303588.1 hypothetical protein [Pseudomonas putida]